MEIKCVFCEQDMGKLKFREDYILLAWQDDPTDPGSFNKVAKCAHKICTMKFIDYNYDQILDLAKDKQNGNVT